MRASSSGTWPLPGSSVVRALGRSRCSLRHSSTEGNTRSSVEASSCMGSLTRLVRVRVRVVRGRVGGRARVRVRAR